MSTVSYPVIDVAKGGSIQGVIDGLNKILDLAVAEYRGQGGTWIIPGRGRLSDTADVASYRNMLTIIRDRVKDSHRQGHDARAGQGREADDGLRRPVRIGDRIVDDGHVRRGGLQKPSGEESNAQSASGCGGGDRDARRRARRPTRTIPTRRPTTSRTRSSSKASSCSSSTATRTPSCTSMAPDDKGVHAALGRRVERHDAARQPGREPRNAQGRRRSRHHRAPVARAPANTAR